MHSAPSAESRVSRPTALLRSRRAGTQNSGNLCGSQLRREVSGSLPRGAVRGANNAVLPATGPPVPSRRHGPGFMEASSYDPLEPWAGTLLHVEGRPPVGLRSAGRRFGAHTYRTVLFSMRSRRLHAATASAKPSSGLVEQRWFIGRLRTCLSAGSSMLRVSVSPERCPPRPSPSTRRRWPPGSVRGRSARRYDNPPAPPC